MCVTLSGSHIPQPPGAPPRPPSATASAKSMPTSRPSSPHILTVSGVSLFASCLRRSALMNAEVQGHRRKATESYRAEQWSSSSTRGSAYSPKGHGNPTSFRPSRDPEVPSASLTEPGNHCCARQEEASDDSGLHAQTPDICREFAHSAPSLTAISILQIRKVALQRAGPLAQGQSAMEVSVTVQGSNKGLWGPKLKLIPTKYAAACQRYLLMSPVICPPAHEPLSYMISEDIGCQTANSINSGTVRASHCPEALTHQ